MAKRFNTFGLSFRVVLFFTRNPEEELSVPDIAEKFDVCSDDVPGQLRRAVDSGLLARPIRGGGPGSFAVYAAGPALLEHIGWQPEACVPVGRR